MNPNDPSNPNNATPPPLPSNRGTPSAVASARPNHSQRPSVSAVDDSSLPVTAMSEDAVVAAAAAASKPAAMPFDAPASASNGGERVRFGTHRTYVRMSSPADILPLLLFPPTQSVVVRCDTFITTVTVTADTSPGDIIQTVARQTKHPVTASTSVLLEAYSALGLERPLRRYERVRDTLNSWDSDQQNSLIVVASETVSNDQNLDIDSVDRTDDPPPGFCVQLHHSSRPGKWQKRWMTLLDSGQMFLSKRPDAGPSDKDSTVVCHLSDFDIYKPKESELRRNLKPPKKFCYAIKSQQKTFVFPNGTNFVHFFCTDDHQLATRFFDLVHGWRSWYLASKLVPPEEEISAPPPPPNFSNPLINRAKSNKETLRISIDGSGEPLMDVSGFKAPDISTLTLPPRKTSSKGSSGSKSSPTSPDGPGTFSSEGLLGDGYEKRRQAEAATRAANKSAKVEGPYTEGPSLLNGGIPSNTTTAAETKSWFPSASEHTARIRANSLHNTRRPPRVTDPDLLRRENPMPAPLLQFDDATLPQPSRHHHHGPKSSPNRTRSMGRRPGAGGGPLIDFATGGQSEPLPNGPPKRTVSRRGLPASAPGVQGPPSHELSRTRSRSSAGSVRSSHSRRHGPDNHSAPPVPPLPNRSPRRDQFDMPVSPQGRGLRRPEPLVDRAR
ncbi:hypothetical protein DCS_02675 [Drechmeria coniospora]|uniref:PH domain-containing protein n=1 Tax=Drechmeria coniospora TaxID=98403 RepID=A0A151GWV9_DRECN|nr:hypothetical protein DCS_02675 [Drechmeria coniospora]KYK61533.1 hypothetical protein DCS_02675 [Drechmeria coniospora]